MDKNVELVNEAQASIDKSILFPMLQMVNFFAHRYEEVVPSDWDLSRREYHILIVIGAHPDVSAIEICELSGYSQMTVSRRVKKLLKNGKITKILDKDDKRKFKLSLTAEGWELYQNIIPVGLNLEAEAAACLSKSQMKSLNQILGTLSTSLTKKPIS
ncbi:MAG: hypothetical protein DRQ47_02955 [Gammaproteobacteria bacterium]|nr:MAG: hypothetical protein DRQ47_02955 [Gammaproteobacteria bacterium]